MLRFLLPVVFSVSLYFLLQLLLRNQSISRRQFGLLYVTLLAASLLIFLGVTGRLHWLFGVLGAALPFVVRLLPVVAKLLSMGALMRRFQGLRGARRPHASGQKSTVSTRFFEMELDHDTGGMDGRILSGPESGRMLSELDRAELVRLLAAVRQDAESAEVLIAFLNRKYPDWHDDNASGQHQQRSDSGELTPEEAYQVLGLKAGVGREEVRDAHRRLMQKLHPDHGGSDYLAARINAAKAVLLDHLEG